MLPAILLHCCARSNQGIFSSYLEEMSMSSRTTTPCLEKSLSMPAKNTHLHFVAVQARPQNHLLYGLIADQKPSRIVWANQRRGEPDTCCMSKMLALSPRVLSCCEDPQFTVHTSSGNNTANLQILRFAFIASLIPRLAIVRDFTIVISCSGL